MHEVLLDQLPYLGELQRFLENLSVMEPPHVKQEIVIEQVSRLRKPNQINKGIRFERSLKIKLFAL